MLQRVLKWVGIVLGVLAGLVVVAIAAIFILGNAEFYRKVEAPTEHIVIPTDAGSIKEGKRLASVYGCDGCHNNDFGGRLFFDDPAIGRVVSANLTSGPGGAGERFTDDDWVRVLRHGVKPDGTRVLIMPSHELTHLNARTLSQFIAYLKTVPPVDNGSPKSELHLLGLALLLGGQLKLFPYDFIDQSAPIEPDVPPGPTVEYGRYLAQVCTECHGDDFTGGPLPIARPDSPKARNITPDPAGIGGWTLEEFIHTMRTGEPPEGGKLDPEAMPWGSFQYMTDDELTALYLYLQTVPPKK